MSFAEWGSAQGSLSFTSAGSGLPQFNAQEGQLTGEQSPGRKMAFWDANWEDLRKVCQITILLLEVAGEIVLNHSFNNSSSSLNMVSVTQVIHHYILHVKAESDNADKEKILLDYSKPVLVPPNGQLFHQLVSVILGHGSGNNDPGPVQLPASFCR